MLYLEVVVGVINCSETFDSEHLGQSVLYWEGVLDLLLTVLHIGLNYKSCWV